MAVAWPTVTELGDLLARPFSEDEETTAQRALDNARAAFQSEARHRIELVEDHEIVIPGSWASRVYLPEPPVTAVSSIKLNGVAVAAGTYSWRRSGLLYRGTVGVLNAADPDLSDGSGAGYWGGTDSELEVKYSHGYEDIPDEVRTVVMECAARVVGNPDGLIATLTEQELRVARRYRTWAMAA